MLLLFFFKVLQYKISIVFIFILYLLYFYFLQKKNNNNTTKYCFKIFYSVFLLYLI